MRIGFFVGVMVLAGILWQYMYLAPRHRKPLFSSERIVENTPVPVSQHIALEAPSQTMVSASVMEDLEYERSSAFSYLDSVRDALGMNQLIPNAELRQAAQNHADYLVANHAKSHLEKKEGKHFTGTSPLDRALYAKYDALSVSENLSTGHKSAKASMDGLMAAIYHRFGFLNPAIDEMGIGIAQDVSENSNSAFVYLMGNSLHNKLCQEESFGGVGRYAYKVCRDREHRVDIQALERAKTYNQKNNPDIIIYPYEGQRGVPPVFYDEDPDPLPDMEVSGFPISVAFNSYFHQRVSVYSFKLFEADSQKEIAVRFMDKDSDPHGRFSSHEYAIFPLERLDFNTRYRVELEYLEKGEENALSWYFETSKIEAALYVVDTSDKEIYIDAGADIVLYFKPRNSHDLLKNIRYPHDLYLEFVDSNTIRIAIPRDRVGDFSVKAGERVVTIVVN